MTLILRSAERQDCNQLFKWANDESVRKNSFKFEQIEYDSHKIWFEKKLKSKKSNIFIALEGNEYVGQIRLDIEYGIGLIDYSVDLKFRGKGYGTEILKEIFDKIKNEKIQIKLLMGRVKYTNLASQRAFEKAGYSHEDLEDYIEYTRQV